jgi:hypothetical protein
MSVYMSAGAAEIMRRRGYTSDALPATVPADECECNGRALRIPPHLAKDGVVVHFDQAPEGEGDLGARVTALERAIAYLAEELGGEGGEGEEPENELNGEEPGEDAAGQSPSASWHPGGEGFAKGMSETSELRQELGNQRLANQFTQGGPTASPSTAEKRIAGQDTLPDLGDINERNRAFWQAPRVSQSVSSGGSPQSTPPPGSRETGRGAEFLPGGRNINMAARLSTTPKELDMGRTWDTSDASLKAAAFYKTQDRQTNALIGSINAKNAAFYARRG